MRGQRDGESLRTLLHAVDGAFRDGLPPARRKPRSRRASGLGIGGVCSQWRSRFTAREQRNCRAYERAIKAFTHSLERMSSPSTARRMSM